MKSKATENKEQGPEDAGADVSAQEAKPMARKKKAAEVAAPVEQEAVLEAAPEVAKAKPAKKASAKKTKPVAAEVETEVAPEAVVEPAAPAEVSAETVEPVAKKAAKKAPKKITKGRDLVVDEPGAKEVAEVLEEAKEDAAKAESEAAGKAQGPAPKLERLQKILAKAGISSRRKAEELILGGQVQINGKIVTELGTKADPERDHVRVDGKLLQGPERIRYFVLNKPKGYVTTVSDPEGRPTVMQFFASERERLYPVGRLDYLSEGLLLVTNDGELANKLTKASSGVEKTYLVKVAGQPTEDMLDVLRGGVVIEKGRPGTYSGRVRTAPAKIRKVREGDNPWYEVIIIEGRNRELRKMFEEIGHHVEKIRRVGYGPLILDLEPGKLRELEAEEVHSLRLAAEGKLKTRRRRGPKEAQLPTVAGKTVRYKKADGKPGYEPRVRPEFQTESKREFKPDFKKEIKAGFKREPKPEFGQGYKKEFKPAFKKEFKSGSKPEFRAGTGGKPEFRAGARPVSSGRPAFGGKPRSNRPPEPPVTDYVLPPRKNRLDEDFDSEAPGTKGAFNPDYKPGFRGGSKPAFRSESRPGSRPAFRKDGPPQRAGGARFDKPFKPAPADDDDFVPGKTPGFKIEPVEDKPRGGQDRRPPAGGRPFRPQAAGPRAGGFGGAKTFRPAGGRPDSPRPSGLGRPSGPDRPSSPARPFRPRTDGSPSGGDRPFRPRPDASADRPTRPAGGRPGEFRPRPTGSGPSRPSSRPKSFEGSNDAPREFRPRESKNFGGPKKFGAPKPFGARKFDAPKPAPGGRNSVPVQRLGPDGQPRVKVRARDSFTGKNKGRPKPRSKDE